MKKYKVHIIWGIVAVVTLAGGFFWGKSMAPSSVGGRGAFSSSTRGGFAGRGAAAGGGFATGQVSAIDSNSITLQLANGNSENVFYSSSTQIIMPQPASISSITPGTMVIVGGSTDSSGNLTATTIQIRNGNTPGFGAGGRTPPGSASPTSQY